MVKVFESNFQRDILLFGIFTYELDTATKVIQSNIQDIRLKNIAICFKHSDNVFSWKERKREKKYNLDHYP